MNRVKVLHIITRLINGGAQKNTLLTVNGLKKEGYDVRLAYGLTSGDEGELITIARDMGIDLYYIPQMRREISPLNDFMAFFKLYKLIKKEGFDIVHTHTSKAGILGRFAAKLAGVSIIIHSTHGHIFDPEADIRGVSKGILGIKLFIFLEKLAAHITDKIITLTELEIGQQVKSGIAKREKFVTAYSGIEIDKLVGVSINVGEKKRELRILLGVPVLGTVGRLDSVKGHRFMLESVPYIKRVFQDIKVLIIGDGPLRAELENHARRLGIADNVLFLGMRDDVPELLRCLDVFVLPSLYEGMGRALVEAEATGVPVVATRVGGVPEVVLDGETGILVPPKDPTSMAEAVILLLKDKDKRIRMGIEGKRFVTGRFGTEVMIDKICSLYKEMRGKMEPSRKSVIDKYSQPEELKEYSDIVDMGLDKAEEEITSKYFKEKGIILDVGCGGGRESLALLKKGHRIIGIDIVPEMLRNTKENILSHGFNIPLSAMDVCNLGFKSGSFDYVPLVNHLISFVPERKNRVKTLKEIMRVLKPGGIIIVSIISRNRGIIHRLYWFIVNVYRSFLRMLGLSHLESGDRFVVRVSRASSKGKMFVHYHTLDEAIYELESAGFEVIESRSKRELIKGIDEPFSKERDYTIYIVARNRRN